jgi:hypothetical protein
MRLLRIFVTAALMLAPTAAWSWNDRGHMMVAAIAWNNLDDATKERVSELLKLNPNYQAWIKTASDDDERDQFAFVMAATWPDFIKRHGKKPDKAGPDDYIDHGDDPANSPDPNRNMGYEDRFLHKYWHFIDMPFSTDNTPTKPAKKPNALTRIILHTKTLGLAVADDDLKSYDLVWLLHLVGDVHQPLHATQRFSADAPDGDAGGNHVKLCDDCRDELHALWDDALGTSSSLKAAIKAAEDLDDAPDDKIAILDPAKWVDESFKIAKASVYRKPIGQGLGPFEVTPAYKKQAKRIAQERVALAGARLAKLIKQNLK